MSTHNRTAIVTGGSRGIGLAIARRLVGEGANVCVTARSDAILRDAVACLSRGGGSVLGIAGRVSDADHQDEVIGAVMAEFGRIDALVNNVAISPVNGNLMDMPAGLLEKIMAVNVITPLNWTRKVAAAWMGANGGSVVNISSVAAKRCVPGVGMYGISKAALDQLTRQLAGELGPAIRVNAVSPAVIRTRMSASAIDGSEQRLAELYPTKRLGEPEDVANAVSFLLGEDSSWITGSNILVDGGVTLGGVM